MTIFTKTTKCQATGGWSCRGVNDATHEIRRGKSSFLVCSDCAKLVYPKMQDVDNTTGWPKKTVTPAEVAEAHGFKPHGSNEVMVLKYGATIDPQQLVEKHICPSMLRTEFEGMQRCGLFKGHTGPHCCEVEATFGRKRHQWDSWSRATYIRVNNEKYESKEVKPCGAGLIRRPSDPSIPPKICDREEGHEGPHRCEEYDASDESFHTYEW